MGQEASRTMGGTPQVVEDESEKVVATASEGTITLADDFEPPADPADPADAEPPAAT